MKSEWMNLNTVIDTLFHNEKMTERMYVSKEDLNRYIHDYAEVLHQYIQPFNFSVFYEDLLHDLETLITYFSTNSINEQKEQYNQCYDKDNLLLSSFLARRSDAIVLKYKLEPYSNRGILGDAIDEYTGYFIENRLTCNQKIPGQDNMMFVDYILNKCQVEKESQKNDRGVLSKSLSKIRK